jgi:hypothetical protein
VEGLLAADEDSSAADGRLRSLYISSLWLVVCSKSRVRARVTSGLLRSTSQQPEPMSLAKPFRVRASRSHASERNHCLDCPATTTIATLESKQFDMQLIPSPLTRLPHVVEVGCRGISGEACRYVTQRRRPAWIFCSHAREINTGIGPCGRLLRLWL